MYLHEQRMADAIKRLYMLGNKPHRDQTKMAGTESLASAGQAAIKRMRQKTPQNAGADFRSEMRNAAGVSAGEIGQAGNSSQDAGLQRLASEWKSSPQQGGTADEMGSFDRDVQTIRGGSGGNSMNPQAIWSGTAEEQHPVEQAMHFDAINKQVEEMPIGGRYTPQGLRMAAEDADLNAQDRMRLKGLIGSGMSLSQPTPYQPSWAVERRP